MQQFLRLSAVAGIFIVVAVAWLMFGAVMQDRTGRQGRKLQGQVSELWGSPQAQQAPALVFVWTTERESTRTERDERGDVRLVTETLVDHRQRAVSPASTEIGVDLRLDQRLKGLMWYSLYDVDFDGAWTYTHEHAAAGELRVEFAFPHPQGLYDDFHFVVDGEDVARTLKPEAGKVVAPIPVEPGQTVDFSIAYRSRGMDEWRYVPAPGVANLERFRLAMTTDFASIDFPPLSLSPSDRRQDDEGWQLEWDYAQIVTGHDIGMLTPTHIQPGELAADLSFSAPVSLLFFFVVMYVLSTLRRIEIHPLNYLLLAAAFFAFHLLFGYLVDHMKVVPAFAICSVVSIVLVISYLRLVVSARFAFVEAGLAQLVYLIGFSLAHFWEGFTGLTVTVLSVLTLFLLMQLTGRLRWSEVLSAGGKRPSPEEGSQGNGPAGPQGRSPSGSGLTWKPQTNTPSSSP